jgi:predicted kinase
MKEVRVQLMANVASTNPKGTSTKKIIPTYQSLVKYAISNIRPCKKKLCKTKIRLFIRKFCRNTSPGTEITPESDLETILNDGILISVSGGENYIGETSTLSERDFNKYSRAPRCYLLKTYVNNDDKDVDLKTEDIIKSHPLENLSKQLCTFEMNGLFPILNGNVLLSLRSIASKYEQIKIYYSHAGYYAFDYCDKISYPPIKDWESAVLREFRGLIVSSISGCVLARRFHKFFNIDETDDSKLTDIDMSQAKIYHKLDGSLVSPIQLDSGQIVWSTRNALIQLDIDLSDDLNFFVKQCIIKQYTPLFEWCQQNRTVGIITHSISSLTLLAIRHNITGDYTDIDIVDNININKVVKYDMNDIKSIDKWINEEGVVICLPNGLRYKYKGEWYRNIARANYCGGNLNFLVEYARRTGSLQNLPIDKVWRHVLNYNIKDKKKILKWISNEEECQQFSQFITRVEQSVNHLAKQILSWYNLVYITVDSTITLMKLLTFNGFNCHIIAINKNNEAVIDKPKLYAFLIGFVKDHKINLVEEILDSVWCDTKHVMDPLNTNLYMEPTKLSIIEYTVDVYLPAKIASLLKIKHATGKTTLTIPKGYKPAEGKLKGHWEQFSKNNILDLRIDLQPHTKSIYTMHNGNEEYALLLVQYGLQNNNRIPKGSLAGILVPVDTEYSLKEYQTALQTSFTNFQIVKMRRKFDNDISFKIYCDLDEVLANFRKGVIDVTGYHPERQTTSKMWQKILSRNNFFEYLELMPNAKTFWDQIVSLNNNKLPDILTGIPRNSTSIVIKAKTKWCQKHLDENINVITCYSSQKYEFSGKNCILIDDNLSLKDNWVRNGGYFIHHYNNDTTIYELMTIMGKLPSAIEQKLPEDCTSYKVTVPVLANSSLVSNDVMKYSENVQTNNTLFEYDFRMKVTDKLLGNYWETKRTFIFDLPDPKPTIVAIDFEWNPYASNRSVSICQIATKDNVYIVDMCNNTDKQNVINMLQNPKILKIGFGLSDDVKRVQSNIINVIDIQSYIVDNYVNVWHGKAPSLDIASQLILERTINKDKRVQMSQWANRPLTNEQIEYAAKDSSVLLDIYNEIMRLNNSNHDDVRQLISKNLYLTDSKSIVFNFDHDLNKPMEVVYSGILLTDDSVNILKTQYNGIHHNKHGNHITINYHPTRHQVTKLNIGQYVDVNIIGYYKNDCLECLLVKTSFGLGHITLSTTEGINAKECNDIDKSQYDMIDVKLQLTGVIGLEVSYIEDELGGLLHKIKQKILNFEKDASPGETLKFKPEELTSTHRAIIHKYAESHFMISQSTGKELHRKLLLTMGRQKQKESNIDIIGTKYSKYNNSQFKLKDAHLVSRANIIYPTENYVAEMITDEFKWLKSIDLTGCLVILRGVVGSGKSTMAKFINGVVASADSYFITDGIYKFDVQQLDTAHKYCYQTAEIYLQNEYPTITIDNTNSTKREYQKYIQLASQYKYKVIILEIECNDKIQAMEFGKRNIHHNNMKAIINMYQKWEQDDDALLVKPYFPDDKNNNPFGNKISLIRWLTNNKLITSVKTTKKTHMWMSVNNMGVKFISIPNERRDEFYQIYYNSGITGNDDDEIKYLTEITDETFRLYFDFDYVDEYPFEDITKLVEILEEVTGSNDIYITGNQSESLDKIKTGLHIHCYDKIVDMDTMIQYRTKFIEELIICYPDKNWDDIIDDQAYNVLRMLGSRKVTKEIDKGNVYSVLYKTIDVDGIDLLKKVSIRV